MDALKFNEDQVYCKIKLLHISNIPKYWIRIFRNKLSPAKSREIISICNPPFIKLHSHNFFFSYFRFPLLRPFFPPSYSLSSLHHITFPSSIIPLFLSPSYCFSSLHHITFPPPSYRFSSLPHLPLLFPLLL